MPPQQVKLGACVRLNTLVSDISDEFVDGEHCVMVNGEKYDWCINCTYNQLNPISSTDCFYEVCLTLIYRQKVMKDQVIGITIMDGNFCSLYPYIADTEDLSRGPRRYTLTHVKYTPVFQSSNFAEALKLMEGFTGEDARERVPFFEEGFSKFYPSFATEFQYDSWFVSMKTKPLDAGAANHTASRECIAERNGKSIRVLSGKINTLFEAERMVLSELLSDWSTKVRIKPS